MAETGKGSRPLLKDKINQKLLVINNTAQKIELRSCRETPLGSGKYTCGEKITIEPLDRYTLTPHDLSTGFWGADGVCAPTTCTLSFFGDNTAMHPTKTTQMGENTTYDLGVINGHVWEKAFSYVNELTIS